MEGRPIVTEPSLRQLRLYQRAADTIKRKADDLQGRLMDLGAEHSLTDWGDNVVAAVEDLQTAIDLRIRLIKS